MYFLNLSLAQFLAVFAGVSAVAVALYLLDRSRRRQVVSTLRFWVTAEQPTVVARRRRIQQPWSLVLQLASMALLLLALAQLRFGSPETAGHDHVLLLETSAWMGARTGNRTLMDIARERARQYLRALPARDRVMLVRADALATPATAFEPDHNKLEAAIQASQPGSTALNLDEALGFARRAQQQSGRRAGEIAFVGAGRTTDLDSTTELPRNLRAIEVPDAIENRGLRKIGMRRSAADGDVWEILVSAHNYGVRPHPVTISLDYGPPGQAGRVVVGSKRITLTPGADTDETFEVRTRAAGILGISLAPHDAFPADDRATLELPQRPMLPVTVYSNQPELLRPLLDATPAVTANYKEPSEYTPGDKGLVILDRFAPPQRPQTDSLWIDPPAAGSPIPIVTTAEQAVLSRWDPSHPIAAGLRTKDYKLEKTSIFEPGAGDARIAEVDAGPVIVARPGSPKIVVFGFHPELSSMRYELATPLLFANLLRWFAPELFRRWELSGGSVGAVKVVLDQETAPANVKVLAEDGAAVPFVVRDRSIHFYSGTPGVVRVVAGDREYINSLTLPEIGDKKWEPPAEVRKGIPRRQPLTGAASDLWPWLALAGGAGLLAEWLLFARFRRGGSVRPHPVQNRSHAGIEAVQR